MSGYEAKYLRPQGRRYIICASAQRLSGFAILELLLLLLEGNTAASVYTPITVSGLYHELASSPDEATYMHGKTRGASELQIIL